MCPLIPQCPFYKAYANIEDPFIKETLKQYCHAQGKGCVQRATKNTYDTFLAANQCPGGEYIA